MILLLVIFVIFFNEARKEVIFLCGNFTKGVSKTSVITQLNTAELSTYIIQETPSGERIVLDNMLTFGLYRCVIEIDDVGRVAQSQVN